MIKYLNKFRRFLSFKIYKEKKWTYETSLSINGIFDYALSNKSKRRIIQELSTSNAGFVKKYNSDNSTISINELVPYCNINDVYISDYINESKLVKELDELKLKYATNARIKNNKVYYDAKKKYLLNNLIPELVACKVFKLVIVKNGEKRIISDIDDLIDLNIYKKQKDRNKNNIMFKYTYNKKEYEIIGIKYGDRFDYAVKALQAVYMIDEQHEYAPDIFTNSKM